MSSLAERAQLPLYETLAWQDRGRCRTVPADFYPEKTGTAHTMAAKKVCRACPVRQICLEHALTHREHGVWGGLTQQERGAMQAARRRNEARMKRAIA